MGATHVACPDTGLVAFELLVLGFNVPHEDSEDFLRAFRHGRSWEFKVLHNFHNEVLVSGTFVNDPTRPHVVVHHQHLDLDPGTTWAIVQHEVNEALAELFQS